MKYVILFMHDTSPSFRVVETATREEAEAAAEKVRAIYDDEGARLVELYASHSDLDQINSDFEELQQDLAAHPL